MQLPPCAINQFVKMLYKSTASNGQVVRYGVISLHVLCIGPSWPNHKVVAEVCIYRYPPIYSLTASHRVNMNLAVLLLYLYMVTVELSFTSRTTVIQCFFMYCTGQ